MSYAHFFYNNGHVWLYIHLFNHLECRISQLVHSVTLTHFPARALLQLSQCFHGTYSRSGTAANVFTTSCSTPANLGLFSRFFLIFKKTLHCPLFPPKTKKKEKREITDYNASSIQYIDSSFHSPPKPKKWFLLYFLSLQMILKEGLHCTKHAYIYQYIYIHMFL